MEFRWGILCPVSAIWTLRAYIVLHKNHRGGIADHSPTLIHPQHRRPEWYLPQLTPICFACFLVGSINRGSRLGAGWHCDHFSVHTAAMSETFHEIDDDRRACGVTSCEEQRLVGLGEASPSKASGRCPATAHYSTTSTHISQSILVANTHPLILNLWHS